MTGRATRRRPLRRALAPILVAGLAACVDSGVTDGTSECPELTHSSEGWEVVSNPSFSFRVPPGFAPDSERADRYRLSRTYLQWEWVQPGTRPPDPGAFFLQYGSCRAVVDERPALVEVGTFSNAGNTTGSRYYASATWLYVPRRDPDGSGQSGPAHLLFQVFSDDIAERELAITSFFSLEFVDTVGGAPDRAVDAGAGSR